MSDISTKLTYLNTTKQLLKTEINKINNVLDDNSTFRSYPQELFNGYLDVLNNGTDTLWNNLEKVSQTGTEVALEGVETAPMKMVLNGNTSQDTTTGRNKLPTNKSDWESGHYDTYGNKSAFATRMRTIDLIPFLPNTTYSVLGTDFYIREYDSNGTFINNLGSVYNGGTFTTNSNTAYLGISINITYSDYVENINQIAIFLNSETNKTWEPYTGGQPSPSPDYPQEVKVVTGENVVSVNGKNLIDDYDLINRYNVASVSENIITSNAINSNYNVIQPKTKTQTINLIENTDYYVSFDCRLKSGSYSARLGTGIIDGVNGTSWSSGNTAISNPNITGSYQRYSFKCIATITTNSIIGLTIQVQQNLSDAVFEIKNIMISTSSDDTYVPYSKTDYPINLGNIELCKIENYQDYLYKDSGKWFKHKEIEKIVLDGNEEWSKQFGINLFNLQHYLDDKLPVAGYGLSNYYKYNSVQSGIDVNTSNGEFALQLSYGGNIFIKNTDYSTKEEFKSWLSTHNTKIYYPLATPTEEEITNTTLIEQLEAISKAKSVKDKTYVTQTNDELPFILDVEAIKEYEVN